MGGAQGRAQPSPLLAWGRELLRSVAGLDDRTQLNRAHSGPIGGNEDANEKMVEVHFALARFSGAEAEELFRKGASNQSLPFGPPQVAFRIGSNLSPAGRIVSRRLLLHRSRTAPVKFDGAAQAQTFVGAIGIINPQAPIELGLEFLTRNAWKQGDILLQRAVPTFVFGIVLRTGGPTKLYVNSQTNPLGRQARM